MDELRPGALVGEGRLEPGDDVLGAVEEALERDRARDRTVVEEDRQGQPARAAPEIRAARIDRVDGLPRRGAERPQARRLVRRQDREPHAGLREHLERLVVHRRLGQPEPLRHAAEARAEVVEPPAHLGDLVAPARQRHDHVVVDLRDGVAVTVARRHARPIGLDHLCVHVRPLAGQPRAEGRAHVEGDLLEVVDDVEDLVVLVDASGRGVRRVALGGYPVVPVVVRGRRVLHFDRFEPGVLAGRLVEVAVDDDRAVQNSSRPRRNSRRPPRGTTTSPEASTW